MYNKILVLCIPISNLLILLLLLLVFRRPFRLVLVVPPSYTHSVGLSTKIKILLLRSVLNILVGAGTRVTVLFTTVYEKTLLEGLLPRTMAMYLPIYYIEEAGLKEILESDKPVIYFIAHTKEDLILIDRCARELRELGVTAKFIVGHYIEKEICPDYYGILCIHTDKPEESVRNSTLVISLTPSSWSNYIVALALTYGKPIIATPRHGIALQYHSTGFVLSISEHEREELTSFILRVINSISEYKKRGLQVDVEIPGHQYSRAILGKLFRR